MRKEDEKNPVADKGKKKTRPIGEIREHYAEHHPDLFRTQ